MGVLDYLSLTRPRATAGLAKERLQFVLAHERMTRGAPDFLPKLQHELLRLIGTYVVIDDDTLKIAVERQGEAFVLGVSVKLQHLHIKGH